MKNVSENIEDYLINGQANYPIRDIYNEVNYRLRNFIQLKLTNEKRNHHLSLTSLLKKYEEKKILF
jgi:hypothetical protein